jgi:hypothetical protein
MKPWLPSPVLKINNNQKTNQQMRKAGMLDPFIR